MCDVCTPSAINTCLWLDVSVALRSKENRKLHTPYQVQGEFHSSLCNSFDCWTLFRLSVCAPPPPHLWVGETYIPHRSAQVFSVPDIFTAYYGRQAQGTRHGYPPTLFDAGPSVHTSHTHMHIHQYERFLRDDEMCVASMFAPIMYPPCPILVFKAIEGLLTASTPIAAILWYDIVE